jgi:GT2 family glycosyltransferase
MVAMVTSPMEKKTKQLNTFPSVAVVILNWNGQYFLEKFLPSVYNSTYPNLKVVVGDNGSTDDSISFVKQYYPAIDCIENDQNYGFAGGYNRILKHIDADYFILLNSDVEVVPGWIEPIIAQMENDPIIGAVQPKIRNYHLRDPFEHAGAAGGYMDRFGFAFCRGRMLHVTERDHGQYDDEATVFWASGAAFFIRKSVWIESGGFDEDFFAHFEEIDLCWRLQHMGYRIAYNPGSTVFHVGGGTLHKSNPRKTYLNFRNNLYMMQKNLDFAPAIWIIFCRLWFDLAALIHFLLEAKWQDAGAVSKAHRHFFRDFFKTAQKRKKIPRKASIQGIYRGSLIWAFYFHKIQRFSGLSKNKWM